MNSEDLRSAVMAFIQNLVVAQHDNHNFDFMLYLNYGDEDGTESIFSLNTFTDIDMHELGIQVLDCSMNEKLYRGVDFVDTMDVMYNARLGTLGFDGYITN
jgi:hypothetical protein